MLNAITLTIPGSTIAPLIHALDLALARGLYDDDDRGRLSALHDDALLASLADPVPPTSRVAVDSNANMARTIGAPARELLVELRDVFGRPMVYPINTAALAFANLAASITLTPQAIATAQTLGFTVRELYGRALPA